MMLHTRKAATILAFMIASLSVNAQPGDRFLDPKARILDVLFPVDVPQRPYLLKLALRFDDADTQLVIVVYPDTDKYWIRRCQVVTYSLANAAQAQLAESLPKLPPEASDDLVRSVAANLKVEVSRFAIDPEALAKSLKELRLIQISPVLEPRVSVDDFSEYEFWYDNWQQSVHYSLAGPAGKAPQDELIRWMIAFRTNLPDLLKRSSASKP
jgi:hypothetical protein